VKKVLIVCTGNSCRSIIAEALINKELDNVKAYSCGANPSGKVNPNAKKVLKLNNAWRQDYYSKGFDDILNIDFDLIVTVCDNAKEQCPIFPSKSKQVHIGFRDPDGKDFSAFEVTFNEIKQILLPEIKALLRN